MMLDDGDYIVIGKLIPAGKKDIQRCYVSFTYVMIGTYTHARTHTYTYTEGIGVKEGERERVMGETYVYTHVDSTHARVNRYVCVCQVI